MALDSAHQSPLHVAAVGGSLACTILLVGRPEQPLLTPAEVNALDEDDSTALHCAAYAGHEQVCAILLAVGARLDARDAYGFSALELAQKTHPEHAELIELLSGCSKDVQELWRSLAAAGAGAGSAPAEEEAAAAAA